MNAWVERVSRKRFKKRFLSLAGFTLLELIIAIGISSVVFLSAANLLINLGKLSVNFVKAEASLMGTALGSFEEIVGRISAANQVAINPTVVSGFPAYPAGCAAGICIQIRVDTAVPAGCVGAACSFTPSNTADDTIYTYWLNTGDLMRTGVTGDPAAGYRIAWDIFSLLFSKVGENRIGVILEARAASGSITDTAKNKAKEYLDTTVIMRSRRGN